MKSFFKLLALLVSTTLSAQLSVAVLDFDGIGISKDEARALSGRFGTEFMAVSKGTYKVVERNQMGQILEEQGFQNTGIVSSEDAVKMGEALGADFIVSGSISKVGTLFSINARLLNVQSAEVIKSISHDQMGDIVDLMTKGIKESASKLMNIKEKKEAPSIAILPFENKGAPEDAFYAYGIVADLISDVTGAGLIRVAGLKDVEKIDHTNLSYDEMSKVLLVRYVAQGTLWKLGSMFQLSLEIFDTQLSKIIYTKRWQTQWEELTTIKDDLSSNILETLKIEVDRKKEKTIAINPEAYEFYLKGKYSWEKTKSASDTEIAIGLLKKAIELDDKLVAANRMIGTIYWQSGSKEKMKKGKEIHLEALEKAKEIGNKEEVGEGLRMVGYYHADDKDYEKAYELYKQAEQIAKDLNNKNLLGKTYNAFGNTKWQEGKLDESLDYFTRFLDIGKSLDEKWSMAAAMNNISLIHQRREEYSEAIDILNQALVIMKELDNSRGQALNLQNIAWSYQSAGNISEAVKNYKLAIDIRKKLGEKNRVINMTNALGWAQYYMGSFEEGYKTFESNLNQRPKDDRGAVWDLTGMGSILFYQSNFTDSEKMWKRVFEERKKHNIVWGKLEMTTFQYLTLNELGKEFNLQIIRDLIIEKESNSEDFSEELFFQLYKLLGDEEYLTKSYEKVQEALNKVEEDLKAVYSNYPIEKQIISEYKRVVGEKD
jgi:TolB-like protein